MNYRGNTSVESILLTGATGVLGGRLLQEILSATDASVYCLVRAENPEVALKRVEEMLFVYDEARTLRDQTWRILPLIGDVSQNRLGLSSETYDELIASINLVMHCAANVSLVAAYSKIAPVNVGGTANVVDFCLTGKIPLLYTSSFSVIGDKLYENGFVMCETDLNVGQGFENMDYERSKFESENIIREAGQRGLDWVVVRPGNIWGDSQTGCYPLKAAKVKGIYYEMLKSLIETGLSISSDEDFDVTPVDYVAQACLYAAMNLHVSNNKTFHLVSPQPPTYDDIVAQIEAYGYVMRPVDTIKYFEALSEGRIFRGGKVYRSTFTDLLSILYDESDAKELAKYDTREASHLLRGAGIICPPVDAALMSRYLDYSIKTGFLPRPDAQQPLAEISSVSKRGGLLEDLYDMDLRSLSEMID